MREAWPSIQRMGLLVGGQQLIETSDRLMITMSEAQMVSKVEAYRSDSMLLDHAHAPGRK